MWEIKVMLFRDELHLNEWLKENPEWEPFNVEEIIEIQYSIPPVDIITYKIWVKREIKPVSVQSE